MAGASFPDKQESPYDRMAKDLPPGESTPTTGPAESTEADDSAKAESEETTELFTNGWLLQKASEIYRNSTDYIDANITTLWEQNLAHFNSEHAPNSFYKRKDFRRSRTFRPKTRANVKQQESALANAAFSTLSLVEIAPIDDRDPQQQIAAAMHKPMLEHRLSYRMPWFLTVQGSYQCTKVYGVCISHQYWSYHEDTEIMPAAGEDGLPVKDELTGDAMGYEETVVREDDLRIDMVEPENFRFDPMCDWRDPANTSPYLIRMVPMYVGEVIEMMQRADSKTNSQAWKKHSKSEILSSGGQEFNRTRQAREGRQRVDPADGGGDDYTTVWAHLNIVKVSGTDYLYWTLGTELVLTDPVPLRDEYPWLRENERPFVVGYSTVEAFRNYPAGDVEQGSTLQVEINDVANQRLDNVKLVLNKRYYVRRGSQVDLDALIRNTPGGGVMMNDPDKDVVTVNTPDVTNSSYQEQSVLNTEFDELVGGFNPAQGGKGGSVAGQQMGAATAGAVQDYGIKIFIETWMEPVLRQAQRLIATYETDETLIRIAGEQAQAFERLGTDVIPDSIFLQGLYLRVDIGMGNTDPMRKAERLIFATTQVAQLPGMANRIKGKPIADAIYGSVGYRDSSNFVMTDNEFEEFQKANPPGPSEIDVKMRELDIRDEDNFARDERERMKLENEFEVRMEDIIARQDQKLDEIMAKLSQAKMSDKTQRDTAAMQAAQHQADQVRTAAQGETRASKKVDSST